MARTHASIWHGSFMQPHITQPGTLYTCDCSKCGQTLFSHEWASADPNLDRDAMQQGSLPCNDCNGRADPDTFHEQPRVYAARLSAPGYMDCTEWSYSTNRRRLLSDLVDLYGPTE